MLYEACRQATISFQSHIKNNADNGRNKQHSKILLIIASNIAPKTLKALIYFPL